jgi:hypothetical protein
LGTFELYVLSRDHYKQTRFIFYHEEIFCLRRSSWNTLMVEVVIYSVHGWITSFLGEFLCRMYDNEIYDCLLLWARIKFSLTLFSRVFSNLSDGKIRLQVCKNFCINSFYFFGCICIFWMIKLDTEQHFVVQDWSILEVPVGSCVYCFYLKFS